MTIAQLLILSLATWRITHMILTEDGPRQLLDKLRQFVFSGIESEPQRGTLAYLFTCHYCMSFSVASIAALLVAPNFADWMIMVAAGSAGSILIFEAHNANKAHWSHKRAQTSMRQLQIQRMQMPRKTSQAAVDQAESAITEG